MPSLHVRKRSRPATPVGVAVDAVAASSSAPSPSVGEILLPELPEESTEGNAGSAATVAASPLGQRSWSTDAIDILAASTLATGGGRFPLRALSNFPRRDDDDVGGEEGDGDGETGDAAIASAQAEEVTVAGDMVPMQQLQQTRMSRRKRAKKKIGKKLMVRNAALKSSLAARRSGGRYIPAPLPSPLPSSAWGACRARGVAAAAALIDAVVEDPSASGATASDAAKFGDEGRDYRAAASAPSVAAACLKREGGDEPDPRGERRRPWNSSPRRNIMLTHGNECHLHSAVLSDDGDDRIGLRHRRSSRMIDEGNAAGEARTGDDDAEEMMRSAAATDDGATASGSRRRRRGRGPHLGNRRSHQRRYRSSNNPPPRKAHSSASAGDDDDGDDESHSFSDEAAAPAAAAVALSTVPVPTADDEPLNAILPPAAATSFAGGNFESSMELASSAASVVPPLSTSWSNDRFAASMPLPSAALPRPALTWTPSAATVSTTATHSSGGSGGGASAFGRSKCGGNKSVASGSIASYGGGGEKKERRVRVKPASAYGKAYMTEEELVREVLRPSAKFEDPTNGGALSGGRSRGKKTGRATSGRRRRASTDPGEAPPDDVPLESGCGDGPPPDSDYDDGRIGTLSVEILSCVGLPRALLDRRFSTKPDVCVYALLADSAFVTDAIPACRSPAWPARSRRAARFPVHHAYARLYVGAFGIRSSSTRKEKDKNDDFAGRVAVDVSALRPGTEYDATLPLRYSTFVYDQRPRGAVRLRLSLEWRNERAAVLSYLRAPTRINGDEGGDFGATKRVGGAGRLAIPCADAKTFRNVALTVHGEHLPGQYGRRAFRATNREAALYQIQLRNVATVLANDAVTYARPSVSLYLFGAWMRCVYVNSVSMVPSYVVGYLLFLLMNNYVAFHLDPNRHGGYQSVNITEILRALVRGGRGGREAAIMPLTVERRAPHEDLQGDGFGDPPPASHRAAEGVDHAEFPFSQRHAYAKRSVGDLSGRSRYGSSADTRMSSRLTMYSSMETLPSNHGPHFAPEPDWTARHAGRRGGEGNDDSNDSIGTDVSDMELEFDSDEREDEEDEEEDTDHDDDEEVADVLVSGTHRSLFVFSSDPRGRSIPPGPQQDVDAVAKRVPFKQNLAKFENRFHDLTLRLFDDRVANNRRNTTTKKNKTKKKYGGGGGDEFDRRLGLHSGKQNPLLALTASYLGPVMNMVRIWLSVVRVSFNVAAWTDPILSFWALCFLLALAVVLAVFPWRAFMLLSGILLVGPQNLILKRIVRRKLNEHATRHDETVPAAESSSAADTPGAKEEDPVGADEAADPCASKKGTRRPKFRISRKDKKKAASSAGAQENVPDMSDEEAVDEAPAFSAQPGSTPKKNVPPRSVIVPYSRLRKERFYDWPPDPNVSQATPNLPTSDQAEYCPIPEEVPCDKADTLSKEFSSVGLRKRLYTR